MNIELAVILNHYLPNIKSKNQDFSFEFYLDLSNYWLKKELKNEQQISIFLSEFVNLSESSIDDGTEIKLRFSVVGLLMNKCEIESSFFDSIASGIISSKKFAHYAARFFFPILFHEINKSKAIDYFKKFLIETIARNQRENDFWLKQIFVTNKSVLGLSVFTFLFKDLKSGQFLKLTNNYSLGYSILGISYISGNKHAIEIANKEEFVSDIRGKYFCEVLKWNSILNGYDKNITLHFLEKFNLNFDFVHLLTLYRTEEKILYHKVRIIKNLVVFSKVKNSNLTKPNLVLNAIDVCYKNNINIFLSFKKLFKLFSTTKAEADLVLIPRLLFYNIQLHKSDLINGGWNELLEVVQNRSFSSEDNKFLFLSNLFELSLSLRPINNLENTNYFEKELFSHDMYLANKKSIKVVLNYAKNLADFSFNRFVIFLEKYIEIVVKRGSNRLIDYLIQNKLFFALISQAIEALEDDTERRNRFIELLKGRVEFEKSIVKDYIYDIDRAHKVKYTSESSVNTNYIDLI